MSKIDRRDFLRGAGTAMALVLVRAPRAIAQDSTMFGPMDQSAYRPVRRPAVGAARAVNADELRDLERGLHCQCGCGMDVYTCRTTDFACPVSPAMHRDVLALLDGGHSDRDVVTAFRDVYGDRVLMAPARQGFNWLAYILPFAVLGAGAMVVTVVTRRWRGRAAAARAGSEMVMPPAPSAEEIDRIDRLVREDGEQQL